MAKMNGRHVGWGGAPDSAWGLWHGSSTDLAVLRESPRIYPGCSGARKGGDSGSGSVYGAARGRHHLSE